MTTAMKVMVHLMVVLNHAIPINILLYKMKFNVSLVMYGQILYDPANLMALMVIQI